MAERFGSQQHPSGGLRFGSQTYTPIDAVAGVLDTLEAGNDAFAADSYPRVNGSLAAEESGSDVLGASGSSSLLFTMHAIESPTSDALIAAGSVTTSALRFGSQTHPGGGLRFGSQVWATLGPSGQLSASESGLDTAVVGGWVEQSAYKFSLFTILADFVDYGVESLGSAITGTLDDGYKVMLPITGPGVSLAWEVDSFGHPSLRLEHVAGPGIIDNIPWYVWDGFTWTGAQFGISDALQGAAFLVESGADTFLAAGANTIVATVALVEDSGDALDIAGLVSLIGAVSALEVATPDVLQASGFPWYIGIVNLLENDGDDDSASFSGTVAVSGTASAAETFADSFAAAGGPVLSATLATAESGSDAFSVAGRLESAGVMAAAESGVDALAADADLLVSGAANLADAGADTAAVSGSLTRLGSAPLRELDGDVIEASATVHVSGSVAMADALDSFAAFLTRESTGEVGAAELDAQEGGADRFVSRGRIGNVVAIPTLDGPVITSSSTRVVTVRARRTAEAA
jgi:hypothetical protein